MPELPEVESIKRSLEPLIVGSVITKTLVNQIKIVCGRTTKRIEDHTKLKQFLTLPIGHRVNSLQRIAKNIIITLDNESVFVIHLKMTGQLLFAKSSTDPKLTNKHSHVILELDNGFLIFNDVRKFGYFMYHSSLAEAYSIGHFADLGADPINDNCGFEEFWNKLKIKKKPLKTALLEQKIVVGIGNIYSDEICFASGVLPSRLCNALSREQGLELYKNINTILNRAIELKGSSISDYVLADGSKGQYSKEHKVYGHKSKPCFVCTSPLLSTKIAGRTTVYCQKCQI
jgi:formamidopyrimidine-DNA glycosylase